MPEPARATNARNASDTPPARSLWPIQRCCWAFAGAVRCGAGRSWGARSEPFRRLQAATKKPGSWLNSSTRCAKTPPASNRWRPPLNSQQPKLQGVISSSAQPMQSRPLRRTRRTNTPPKVQYVGMYPVSAKRGMIKGHGVRNVSVGVRFCRQSISCEWHVSARFIVCAWRVSREVQMVSLSTPASTKYE